MKVLDPHCTPHPYLPTPEARPVAELIEYLSSIYLDQHTAVLREGETIVFYFEPGDEPDDETDITALEIAEDLGWDRGDY